MEKVKSLRELTEAEFNKLKEAGLLKTIYPDAPKTYKEIKGTRPKPIAEPNFQSIIDLCEQYLDSKQDPKNYRMKDGEHYIFEEAIKCVYGNNKESGIWDFINSHE
jgi:hypothetical protein